MTWTGRTLVSGQKPTWSEPWKTGKRGSTDSSVKDSIQGQAPDPSYPHCLGLCKLEFFQTGTSVRPMVFSVPSQFFKKDPGAQDGSVN